MSLWHWCFLFLFANEKTAVKDCPFTNEIYLQREMPCYVLSITSAAPPLPHYFAGVMSFVIQ